MKKIKPMQETGIIQIHPLDEVVRSTKVDFVFNPESNIDYLLRFAPEPKYSHEKCKNKQENI
ncbi:hypothetical protein HYT26_00350 [Candidatus Pacearchaeota archaeon]|nr:hypothetical protein [Candidatus Pacearchaeota archaeon]